ncbi:hypothetical protein SERLA73DRAFT_178092 [Serpula lacrymans var. lacrymans S7.3]|uniref:Uncharacterized protein n=2 Tax=Serpula lacrymans var. lacrymans TaxID=341189 RepID=F8PQJ2_SERL3|nr:uncharacterized protein SERLADRAFT_462292 [Serpula lacrymans var. lacrymans S7.9]EGO02240.1 hypothetical protein SERLA73DRAFT_178092 [Serpula lacrymans var. lacrymans S7.3]EGO27959.1 hypothetical protein SERLADRAFT_462292 [Serpula lacrymans var. lacrymans S7.9]
MPSEPHRTIFIPADLGTAADFNSTAEFLRYEVEGSHTLLEKGEYWLSLSLSSLRSIQEQSRNSGLNFDDYVNRAKSHYDNLDKLRQDLEERRQSSNLFKWFFIHYDTRKFVKAGRRFYKQNRRTSEELKRRLLSSENLNTKLKDKQLSCTLPPRQGISGIAVEVPPTPDPQTIALIDDTANCLGCFSPSSPDHLGALPEEPGLDSQADSRMNENPEVSCCHESSGVPRSLSERQKILSIVHGLGAENAQADDKSRGDVHIHVHAALHNPTFNVGGSSNSGSVTQSVTQSPNSIQESCRISP